MSSGQRNPPRLPPWFKISLAGSQPRNEVKSVLRELGLHSVCEGARCPNLCECWRERTATFMILGDRCTRNCAFCAVDHGPPARVDPDEPGRVAEAAVRLDLRHVVVTSVTRDDLPDGGANHFATTIRAVKSRVPHTSVEVLTPDFGGVSTHVEIVLAAQPEVFNHNVETCRRLTGALRDGADYSRSLRVLACAADYSPTPPRVKSGFMLGVGENDEDVRATLADLRTAGVVSLTIGQYLSPSPRHWPVERYVPPEEFERWRDVALNDYGFSFVASAPHVRSSYHAAVGIAG